MTLAADDCFAAPDALMRVERALAVLNERVQPLEGCETVPLRDALGRFLAEDVTSPLGVPPHDNAAVDGYAVFFDDLATDHETRLPVGGRIAAGHRLERPARRGVALQVFTGAVLPAGPDTVAMSEDCRREGDVVVIGAGLRRGANRRRAGEDVQAGDVVLRRGRRLRAEDIGLAAAIGRARVSVHRRLRAAVFSTGDEVREPGTALDVGCIYDSNRYMIIALLEGLGVTVSDLGILPDRRDAVSAALQGAATEHDLLVTSGGVSMGEEDHVGQTVAALGALHAWRLAIKPGRPIAFGQIGAAMVVGLPGNPVAAAVTFMRLVRPLVIRRSGGSEIEPQVFRVRAGFDFKGKKPGRREWLRVRLVAGPDGPVAEKFPRDGSGILTSMVQSTGLVELGEEQGAVVVGSLVDFLPFGELRQ